MSDTEKYRAGARHSARMAGEVVTREVREIWLTVERSYRFLLEREERIDLETHRDRTGAKMASDQP